MRTTPDSADALQLASVCPGALLHEVRDQLAPLAEARRQELIVRMDAPPHALTADRALLRQLLLELVEHAIRSTRESGRILVSAITTREADESEWIEFTVKVSGIAVRRSDPTDGSPEAGRGRTAASSLADVQRVAALHGGRMRLESEPGHGTTYIVALPQAGPRR